MSAAIEHWLADGIITAEQATQMRADPPESPPSGGAHGDLPASVPRTSRAALVTEALGYLGGVIIVAALGLVVGSLWDQMSVAFQFTLIGVVTVVLVVAGALIPARLGATGARLRSVLWLASTAALAALLGVGLSEWSTLSDGAVASCVALGTTLYAAVLWWVHRHLPQHAATFIALLVAVGAGVSLLPNAEVLPGLAIWGVGATWFALAWGGVIPGRQVGTVLGAAGMVVFTITLMDEGWGVVLALVTVSALVALALTFRDLILLGVASIGTLMVLPPIMGRYFSGALAPALVLLCLGVLLVVAAVATTRRRGQAAPGEEPRWAMGTRRAGVFIAAVVVAAVATIVLLMGLA